MNVAGSRFQLGHQRSLDGLRGVAILFVLLDHGAIVSTGFGFVAVNTFFVLSGFLITCLLVAEKDGSGKIDFISFYCRRALRLLPALLAMLLAFLVFAFLAYPHPRAIRELSEALCAFFYCMNFAQIFEFGRDGSLGHTWSLAIEEQFYFVWPVLLSFLLVKTSRRSLLCWIFLGAFSSAALRFFLYQGDADITRHLVRLFVGPDMRADSLLLGCFAGIIVSSNLLPRDGLWLRLLKTGGPFLALGLVALAACWEFSPWMICAGWFLESILAAALIMQLVKIPGGILHRVLENRVLVYVGQISYGLYVWHFPMLCIMREYRLPWEKLAYLIPVFIMAILSFVLIESPFLRLKHKMGETA